MYSTPLTQTEQVVTSVCGKVIATRGPNSVFISVKGSNSGQCQGLITWNFECYYAHAAEYANEQKTTCNSFCDTYADRYDWPIF